MEASPVAPAILCGESRHGCPSHRSRRKCRNRRNRWGRRRRIVARRRPSMTKMETIRQGIPRGKMIPRWAPGIMAQQARRRSECCLRSRVLRHRRRSKRGEFSRSWHIPSNMAAETFWVPSWVPSRCKLLDAIRSRARDV